MEGSLNALITKSKYQSISASYNWKLSAPQPIVLCSSDGARVALKIIKNVERYREAAVSEVEVLEQLKSLDSERKL